MSRAAVIVAGGSGTRMGSELPKQFLPLGGVPVIFRTVRKFLEFDPNIRLVVVLNPASHYHWVQLSPQFLTQEEIQNISTTPGGKSRCESVFNGLEVLSVLVPELEHNWVAIHDAVRPFIQKSMLETAYHSASKHGASVCCVPVKSSMRKLTGNGSQAVDRSAFFHVQTPQVFPLAKILLAYHKRPHSEFTDDASLYEAMGHTVSICEGSYDNIKITTPEDLYVAEGLLKRQS